MTAITHHTKNALLASYAAGSLSQPYAVVVAAHISLCLESRATFEAHQVAGGAVLDCAATKEVSDGLKSSVFDLLDAPVTPEPTYQRSGIYPGPVMEALKNNAPHWQSLGLGLRQSILSTGREGSVRLLYVPAGMAVPNHSHNGLELTLVLQGSFRDETGRYGVGDLEIADPTLKHTPTADTGLPCICLAATDAPLRFTSLVPRLLQPLFRI